MGGMAMGECKNWQRKSYIALKNCKHIEGRYGRLPLRNVYTCHGIFSNKHKFCQKEVLKSHFQNISSQVYCKICQQKTWFLW